jgi:hypothetical protein
MGRATVLAVWILAASLGGLASGASAHAIARAPLVAGMSSGCSPGEEGLPALVLVARNLIHKGTLGLVILKKQIYQVAAIPCSQRLDGALDDPRLLRGRIAIQDIYPGQQLVRSDFSGVLKGSLTSPVHAGSYAQLTVRVTPPGRCTIRVTYNSISEEPGLGPKRGGRITWRWKVRSGTRPGRWPIIIRCGASGSLTLRIRVLAR